MFVGTDFGPGSLTKSGYPRIVKEWKRGTPLAEAAVVLEGQPDDMSVTAFRDLTPGFERDVVIRRPTFWTSETFLRRDGKLIKIDKPDDAEASFAPRVAPAPASVRLDGGRQDLPGRGTARDRSRGIPEGDARFDVLFEPTERKSLAGFSPTRHHILLNELDNVRSRVYVLTHRDEPLAPRAAAGRARVWRGERRRRRRRRVRRLLPERHRLPDADDAGPRHRRRQVPRRRSSSFPRSSTPMAWPSRSTRPSRRTARAFPTSRSPART